MALTLLHFFKYILHLYIFYNNKCKILLLFLGHFFKPFFHFNNSLLSVVFEKRSDLSVCSKAFKIYDSFNWKFNCQVLKT